jgi:hypothetical protein
MKLSVTKGAAPPTKGATNKISKGSLKLSVSKKNDALEAPARGFIKTKGYELAIYTDDLQRLRGIELTMNGKKTMIKDPYPFIMWGEAEARTNEFLQELAKAAEPGDILHGLVRTIRTRKPAKL